eukprot:56207-Alexandrium_andersonii.AAC.2
MGRWPREAARPPGTQVERTPLAATADGRCPAHGQQGGRTSPGIRFARARSHAGASALPVGVGPLPARLPRARAEDFREGREVAVGVVRLVRVVVVEDAQDDLGQPGGLCGRQGVAEELRNDRGGFAQAPQPKAPSTSTWQLAITAVLMMTSTFALMRSRCARTMYLPARKGGP